MGLIATYMERHLRDELDRRGVAAWYDEPREWLPWLTQLIGRQTLPDKAQACTVKLAGRTATLICYAGSYYEVLMACEPLVSTDSSVPLVVYLPGERAMGRLSPLRELECLGGTGEPLQHDLRRVARAAFRGAGLSEAKIDELLNRDGLTFVYLDAVKVGEEGGASPLAPVFGSSRELDVFPSFLTAPDRRAEAAQRGLLEQIAALSAHSLGLPVKARDQPERMVRELARSLLVAEMRSDLQGAEPVEVSQLPRPQRSEQIQRIRDICARLRLEHADAYESMADAIERDLGLAQAKIDPLTLGRIDTFRFEERRLLEACDRLLAEGKAEQVLEVVGARKTSFWADVRRHPERRAAWDACEELARLSLALDAVATALHSPPREAHGWVEAYVADGSWHVIDQRFREARFRLARLQDPSDLERGAEHVFARYDALLERLTEGFVEALKAAHWQVRGALAQTSIYQRHVAKRTGPVAYLLVDAMRYEMGAALASLLMPLGAANVRLEAAIAAAPTITDLGMVALLPGAERSFTLAQPPRGGVAGSLEGKVLSNSTARMDYAKGAVPGLVETTLDRLLEDLPPKRLKEVVKHAPVILIRSQEIDGAGESVSESLAKRIMGTVLEDIRKGVVRLAEAGITQFVITADHGHLFAARRGDDMKIDPPEGGQLVDLHRRCWIGRGGSTPSSCVRLSAADLGYGGTDLELVVPKGTAVFKAGGSLSFHHGGLSLQELIVPVLTFELKGKGSARTKMGEEVVALEAVPTEITNLIFSVSIRRTDLALEPLELRILAEAYVDNERKTVGQAKFATRGFNPTTSVLTLEPGEPGREPVAVGIQLEDEEVAELRVLIVQVGTDRTLKDTAPIPVRITR